MATGNEIGTPASLPPRFVSGSGNVTRDKARCGGRDAQLRLLQSRLCGWLRTGGSQNGTACRNMYADRDKAHGHQRAAQSAVYAGYTKPGATRPAEQTTPVWCESATYDSLKFRAARLAAPGNQVVMDAVWGLSTKEIAG